MRNSSRLKASAVIVSVMVLFACLWYIEPEKARWLPHCPFHQLTGLHCPGCGTLRCLHRLTHGDLLSACRFNLLVVMVVPFMIYYFAAEIYETLVSRSFKLSCTLTKGSIVIFAVMLIFGIARNIPIYPFTLLAPH